MVVSGGGQLWLCRDLPAGRYSLEATAEAIRVRGRSRTSVPAIWAAEGWVWGGMEGSSALATQGPIKEQKTVLTNPPLPPLPWHGAVWLVVHDTESCDFLFNLLARGRVGALCVDDKKINGAKGFYCLCMPCK